MNAPPHTSDDNHPSSDGCNWLLTDLERELEQRATEIAIARNRAEQTGPTGEERPVTNRTPNHQPVRVARTSLVSPDEQSGELPFHDTEPKHHPGQESPATEPTTAAHTLVTANSREHTDRGTPTVIDTDHIIGPPRLWVPWSPLLTSIAIALLWMAVRTTEPPGLVTVAVMVSVVVCSALLMTGHALTVRATRPGRRR